MFIFPFIQKCYITFLRPPIKYFCEEKKYAYEYQPPFFLSTTKNFKVTFIFYSLIFFYLYTYRKLCEFAKWDDFAY